MIHTEAWYREASDPITRAILTVRQRFLDQGRVECLFDIGSGLCEEFAKEVLHLLRGPYIRNQDPSQRGHYTDFEWVTEGMLAMFAEDNGDIDGPFDFDLKALASAGTTKPPPGWTWEELNQVPFGNHVWIWDTRNNLHYDAEAPEGVKSIFGLPFHRRFLEAYGPRIKGTGPEDRKVWDRARKRYLESPE